MFWYFYTYEHLKFHAQLSMKKVYNPRARHKLVKGIKSYRYMQICTVWLFYKTICRRIILFDKRTYTTYEYAGIRININVLNMYVLND